MVPARAAPIDNLKTPLGVRRGSRQHLLEQVLGDMVRAAAGDEKSRRVQKLHRAQVDFLVAAKRGVNRRFVAGERRWIEDDGVEAAPLVHCVAEEVEGVGNYH